MEDEIVLDEEVVPRKNLKLIKKSGKGKIVIIILVIILVLGVVGYFVYDKVIKKDEKPKESNVEEKDKEKEESKPNNTEESKKDDNTTNTNSLDGMIYKTKDGKNVLKIVSKTDEKALNDAKQYEFIDVNGDFDYFGYYNDTLFVMYNNGEEEKNITGSKYIVLGGREKGNVPQCRDTHEFIIDVIDGTLVNMTYTKDGAGQHYLIHRVGDKYYFSEGGCAMSFLPNSVYNEQLKKLGDIYYGNDASENIYVLNGGIITKYRSNGEVVKTNSLKYDSNNLSYNFVITDETIYLVLNENGKVYLLNGLLDEKYEIGTEKDIPFSSFEGVDNVILEKKDNNIVIKVPKENSDEIKETFTFNSNTKEITKN